MTDNSFLFDDFFLADDAPGIEVTLRAKGRDIPLRVRPLSVTDQVEVQAQALVKHVTPDGQITIDRLDEAKASSLLLARSIVSWPFTFKDGSPVPVTPENCARMLGEVGKQLTQALDGLTKEKAEVLPPFANSSDAA
jgi:hypothetical protein